MESSEIYSEIEGQVIFDKSAKTIQRDKERCVQQIALKQRVVCMQKYEVGPHCTPYTNIKKWTTDQKCKNYSYKIFRHKWALPIFFHSRLPCPYHLPHQLHVSSLSSTNLMLGALRSGIVRFFIVIYLLSPGLSTQQTVWMTERMNVYAEVETNSLSWASRTPPISMICRYIRFFQ